MYISFTSQVKGHVTIHFHLPSTFSIVSITHRALRDILMVHQVVLNVFGQRRLSGMRRVEHWKLYLAVVAVAVL